jgi:hypothetical protein
MNKEIRVKTIASNLNALMASDEAKTIPAKLRKIAVENFDWNLRAEQMVEAYQAFIDKNSE